MKSRLKFLLPALLLLANVIVAQTDGVFDRINGIKLNRDIFIVYDTSKAIFKYFTDDDHTSLDAHELDSGSIFNVRNHFQNEFDIYSQFYNPLRYSLKSSQKDVADPEYKAISDYISSLPGAAPITAQTINSTPISSSTFKIAGLPTSTAFDNSVLLYEWEYQLQLLLEANGDDFNKKDSAAIAVLIKSINKIKVTESYLYDSIAMSINNVKNSLTFQAWIKKGKDTLYKCPNDYNMFKALCIYADTINTQLKKSSGAAAKNLKEIVDLLTSGYDLKIGPLIHDKTAMDNFKLYSRATAATLSTITKLPFGTNDGTLKMYNSLIVSLVNFAKQYRFITSTGNNQGIYNSAWRLEYDDKIGWKRQTMKQVDFNIVQLAPDGTEQTKTLNRTTFIVAKKLKVYPFISTGLVYTQFSYPNYAMSTTNGVNTVAQVGSTSVNLRPVAFLNLIVANWEPIYPFLQLGITTGVNDAIYPIGVGLALGSSFLISGGTMIGQVKDLTKLKVGDVVQDNATLQNDLSDKAIVSWYFSVNYNLGKKS